jgi:branched-chain amino acid transport system substrate-binding protein
MKAMTRTFALAALTAALACGTAQAQQINVKIGALTDMSSLYADLAGPGTVEAVKLAVEDFQKANPNSNVKVEIISADHQNKADIGTNIANQWIDREGVDLIVDTPNSGVALAVNEVIRSKNKVFINSGAASSDLTGAKCSPNTVHWTYDTWMLANGTGKAIVQNGGDTWFFLTSDYAFGHALERDTAAVVEKTGGKVVGKVRHPINSSDFSSFLCRRSRRRPRSSVWPMPAAIPSTRSSRRRSSASSRAASRWPVFWSLPATSTRSDCRRRRA